jgi:protein KRI1
VGFLQPKKRKEADSLDENGLHPSRAAAGALTITEEDVAKADEDPELYLSNFMTARGWVADGPNWKAFESDDGDSDLEKADEFEAAYNMRFEDPEKSNEVLKTYARDIAAARSVRREKPTGRKRQRELEKERKEQEKHERAEEKARLKKLRLEEAEDRLQKIRKTAGTGGKRLTDDELIKFLDDAWEDDKWEEQMKKRFGEDYYEEEDADMKSHDEDEDSSASSKTKKKKPKKPTWDDDIDIGDIVKDDSMAPQFSVADLEDSDDEVEVGKLADGADAEESDEQDDSRPSKKRKTSKDHKKDRLQAKKAAKQSRTKLEALIGTMVELESPAALNLQERKNKNSSKTTQAFRWRETSPTSYGMTARDILLAPSDKALNKFAGIKKYVPYKEREAKEQERKRLSKKGRLRKWRREVFGKEFEKTGPTFDLDAVDGEDEEGKTKVVDLDIREGDGAEKKKRKRKRGHKKGIEA